MADLRTPLLKVDGPPGLLVPDMARDNRALSAASLAAKSSMNPSATVTSVASTKSSASSSVTMTHAEMEKCKQAIRELQEKLWKHQCLDVRPQPLGAATETKHKAEWRLALQWRRILKGHFGKIYSLSWCLDSARMCSVGNDGQLILWNAARNRKIHVATLRSAWVLTCCYSPSGRLVATAGLDNVITLHQVPFRGSGPSSGGSGSTSSASIMTVAGQLAHHDGYVSACKFLGPNDDELLSSSGDSTLCLWDVAHRAPKVVFRGHLGDVMTVSVPHGISSHLLASGSCDNLCKLWDRRTGDSVMTFGGHESDVNCVDFLAESDGWLASASDDASCRLFDTRMSLTSLQVYRTDRLLAAATSVTSSKTGALLISAADDYNCYVWDTLSGTVVQKLEAHESRVSCVSMSPDGTALASGSWDTAIRVWA